MLKDEIKFLLSHSAIYSLGTLISQLVGFLLLPLYTRYLTPEEYGIMEMVTITNSVIGIVLSFGVSSAIVRFFYSQDDDVYRKTVISTSAILYSTSAFFGGLILFNMVEISSQLIFGSEQYAGFFKIAFAYLLIGGFNNIGDTYFRVRKKPGLYISISLTRLILLISLNIYFVVFAKSGIIGVLYSTLIVRIIFSILVMVPVLYQTGLRFKASLAKDMLKFSLPMIPSNIIRIAINQSDRFFITALLSIADTGVFSLAVKLGNGILVLIAYPFNLTFMQRRFEIVQRDDAGVTFTKVFTYFSLLMFFMGLLISVFIDELLFLMTTPGFYKAGILVPFVVFYSIVFSFRFHFDFGILWSKKTHLDIYINLVVLVLSITANYFCIKYMGLLGAVYAKCLVTICHTMLIYFISNGLYNVEYEFRRVFWAFGLGIVFFMISIFINTGMIPLDIFVKVGLMLLYFIVLCQTKIIEKEETDYLKQITSGFIKKFSFGSKIT